MCITENRVWWPTQCCIIQAMIPVQNKIAQTKKSFYNYSIMLNEHIVRFCITSSQLRHFFFDVEENIVGYCSFVLTELWVFSVLYVFLVKYLNAHTGIVFLRFPKRCYRLLWSALPFITCIETRGQKIPCFLNCLHVGGKLKHGHSFL